MPLALQQVERARIVREIPAIFRGHYEFKDWLWCKRDHMTDKVAHRYDDRLNVHRHGIVPGLLQHAGADSGILGTGADYISDCGTP